MSDRTAWRVCRDNGWWSVFGKKKARDKGTRPRPAVLALAMTALLGGVNGPAAVDIDHGEAPAATTLEEEPLADADLAQPVIEIQEVGHMQYSEVWNPPDAGEGFWQVVDLEDGYPETGGTRYILAHACENRECAGDRLIDLETGDTLDILGEHYRVDENYIAHIDAIGDQPIWEHVPQPRGACHLRDYRVLVGLGRERDYRGEPRRAVTRVSTCRRFVVGASMS